jgi:class 3 adenylate cyclase
LEGNFSYFLQNRKRLQSSNGIFIILSYFAALIIFVFSLYFFLFTNEYIAGLILLISVFLIVFNLISFLSTRKLKIHINIFFIINLALPFIIHLFAFPDSFDHILWGAAVPLTAFLIMSHKASFIWTLDYLCLVLITGVIDSFFLVESGYSSVEGTKFFIQVGYFVPLILFLFFIQYFAKKVEKLGQSNNELIIEKSKSDELVSNLLPEEIAMRMKYEERLIADSYEEVTVLFADMVGFTQLSSKISPKELVDLLNVIFSSLDAIIDEHGMEKIKTMGDAYMAASGIPNPIDNHAEVAADVSLRFMEEVSKFSEMSGIDIKIRIGLHTGPVIAGVIGTKKAVYDLWGDTVNVASRMEHHGLPDRIQVSKATRDLLKEKYNFISRGEIEVKGKGKMETYLLLDKKKIYAESEYQVFPLRYNLATEGVD